MVLDPTTGLHTEINERGPAVSDQELELFREKLLYLAQGASICVFAGSLPRGVEQDVYDSLIREVRRLGVTTMIDTDGEPLRLAMRAEPDLVSPNELEAEELVGHEFNDVDDRAQAVVEMTRLGAREAIMTVSDGCYARVLEDGTPTLHRVRVAGAGGALGRRLRRCVPGRLRGGPLRGPGAGRVPALRSRLRRRVDPALRRRDHRSGARRAAARARSRPSGSSSRPRSAERSVRERERRSPRSAAARIDRPMVAATPLLVTSATRSTLLRWK